jgi:leucyl aminopeptidase
MNKILLALAIIASSVYAAPKHVYITVGTDAAPVVKEDVDNSVEFIEEQDGVTLMKVREDKIPEISHMMHEKFKRCGGFFRHDSLAEARGQLLKNKEAEFNIDAKFFPYTIDMSHVVTPMINTVKEQNIRNTIVKLSSFHNRYYKAQTGVQSQNYLAGLWGQITKARSDAKVSLFQHKKWPQPSVLLTIKGTTKAEEIVIIGGHADSISGYFGGATSRAPGADDNASGIATITEAIRALVVNNYKPTRTIIFMGYAAEEVGLLGSKEIASLYKKKGINVVGALQLDMTNFHGSKRSNIDIALMSDFTNAEQNKFLGKVIDKYVGVSWGYSKCGYGCSDHASWHSNGYRASMPFESNMNDMNKNIHTKNDLISKSGGTADHALKFSKLAIGFMVEMAK